MLRNGLFKAGKAVAKVVAGDNAAESEFARSKKSTSKDWKIGQNESEDQSYRRAGCTTAFGKTRACNLCGSFGKVQKKPCRTARPCTR